MNLTTISDSDSILDFSDLFVSETEVAAIKESARIPNEFFDVLFNVRCLEMKGKAFEWSRELGKNSVFTSVKDILTTKPVVAIKGYPYRVDVGARFLTFDKADNKNKTVCQTVKAEITTPGGDIITRNSHYPSQQPITLMYKSNKEPNIPNWAVNLPDVKLFGSRMDPETNTNLACVKCIETSQYFNVTPDGVKKCSPNSLLYFLVTHLAFIDDNSLFSDEGKVKLNWVELKPGCSSEILTKGSGKFVTQVTESSGKVHNIDVEYPFLVYIKLSKMFSTSSLGTGEYDFEIDKESYYEDVKAVGEILKEITQSGNSLTLKKDRTNVYVDPYILFSAKLTSVKYNQDNLLVGKQTEDNGDFAGLSKEQKAAMILSIHQQELASKHFPIFSEKSKVVAEINGASKTEEEVTESDQKVVDTIKDSFKLPSAFSSKKK